MAGEGPGGEGIGAFNYYFFSTCAFFLWIFLHMCVFFRTFAPKILLYMTTTVH